MAVRAGRAQGAGGQVTGSGSGSGVQGTGGRPRVRGPGGPLISPDDLTGSTRETLGKYWAGRYGDA